MQIDLSIGCPKGRLSTDTLAWVVADVHKIVCDASRDAMQIELAQYSISNTAVRKAIRQTKPTTYIESYKTGSWEVLLVGVLTGYIANVLFALFPAGKRLAHMDEGGLYAMSKRIAGRLASPISAAISKKTGFGPLVVQHIECDIVVDSSGYPHLKVNAELALRSDVDSSEYRNAEAELVATIERLARTKYKLTKNGQQSPPPNILPSTDSESTEM